MDVFASLSFNATRGFKQYIEISLRAVCGTEGMTVLGKHSQEVAMESRSADEACHTYVYTFAAF